MNLVMDPSGGGVKTLILMGWSLVLLAAPVLADTARDAYMRAVKLEQARNYAGAGQEYKRSLQLDPRYVYSWRGMGNCYYSLGYPAKAIESYDKYLVSFPTDQAIKNFVARLKSRAGAPSPASTEGVYILKIPDWKPSKDGSSGHNFYVSLVEFPKKEELRKVNGALVTDDHTVLRNLKLGQTYYLFATTVHGKDESSPDYKGTIDAMPANLMQTASR
jgi:tetratricopeptide (TPR) repeat protein